MKVLLKETVKLKGNCVGTTAKLIERTVSKALYRRDDGYDETFIIRVKPEKIYMDGRWVPTGNSVERYPRDEAFGLYGWCDRNEEKIRSIYEGLPERRNTDSAMDVSRFIRRSPLSKGIVPPEENNVKILKQSIQV